MPVRTGLTGTLKVNDKLIVKVEFNLVVLHHSFAASKVHIFICIKDLQLDIESMKPGDACVIGNFQAGLVPEISKRS